MVGSAAVREGDAARTNPRVVDALLGAGVTLTVAWLIAADVDGAGADYWAYSWAVALGSLMLVRRRHPGIVVVLTGGAVIAYHAADHPPIGVAVPLTAAVFSAAEHGRTPAALITSASVVLCGLSYRLAAGQDPGFVVGYELPGQALLLAGAVAFGDSVRSRRELRRKSEEVAALTADRYAREAEQQVMAERLDIARELHDSMGHALTVITLHSEVLEEALTSEDAEVRRSLEAITDTTSATFADLRRTVLGLRDGGRPPPSPVSLLDLESLTRAAGCSGLEVSTQVDLRSSLPPSVEATVYRIVQEAITNVVRHAGASRVEVGVRESGGRVEVSVVDDGRGDGGAAAGGTGARRGGGIVGMRERAQLLGGDFAAGPRDGGFAVRATIPLQAG